MGQYYTTTDPQSIDFIQDLPTNYMQAAIQTADQQNDQQINQADLLQSTVAKVNYLPNDAERVKAKQAEYDGQINDLVNQINTDPANYRKHMPTIRALGRNLNDDLSSGEFSQIMGNANKFQAWDTQSHKQVLDGSVTQDAYQTMRAKMLSDFSTQGGTAYNQSTKVGNTLSTEDISKTADLNKIIKDATDNIKANSSDWAQDKTNGQYIFTNKNKDERVEASRVANVALESVLSDPNAMSYLKQGSKYGYLKGVYDKDGSFINPYTIDSKTGLPQFNPNSLLAAPISAAVGKNAYRKTEAEQAMKVNEYGIKANDYAHQEKMAAIDDAYKSNDEGRANQLKIDSERSMAILRNALANGTTEQQVMDKLKGGSNANTISSSPDGVTTITPFAGLDKYPDGSAKPVTSEGINNVLLPVLYSRMSDNLAHIKDPNLTPNQRAMFQQEYDDDRAQVNKLSDWASVAHDYAIGKLGRAYDAEDLNTYNKYIDQNSGLKKTMQSNIANLRGQLQQLRNPEFDQYMGNNPLGVNKNGSNKIPPAYLDNTKATKIQSNISSIENTMGKFDKMSQTLKDGESKWFDQNKNTTKIKLNGVGLSVDNKNLIYNSIKANPDAVQVHDLNGDGATDSDGNNGTKEMTIANQAIRKMIANGEPISNYLDIQQVNAPASGMGVTVTAKLKPSSGFFKNIGNALFTADYLGNNPYDKTILLTLPDNTLHSLGSNMAKGTPSEKGMADLINNRSKASTLSAITNQLTDNLNDTNRQPYSTTTIYDPETRQVHAIRVQPYFNPISTQRGDAMTYKVFVDDGQHNWVPFNYNPVDAKGQPVLDPSSHKPVTMGEFANPQAVVDALYGDLKINP